MLSRRLLSAHIARTGVRLVRSSTNEELKKSLREDSLTMKDAVIIGSILYTIGAGCTGFVYGIKEGINETREQFKKERFETKKEKVGVLIKNVSLDALIGIAAGISWLPGKGYYWIKDIIDIEPKN